MEQFFYCIYDLKASMMMSGIMQVIPSDAAAERWFMDMIASPGTTLNAHPEDFVLVRVGSIDQDTLAVKSYAVGCADPVVTGKAIVEQFKRPPLTDEQHMFLEKREIAESLNGQMDMELVK